MAGEIKPTAELVGHNRDYKAAADFVVGMDVLPLGKVINDEKVTDHHAIIPTRSEHNLDKMSDDDRRVYDMVARRFLAVFHPEAVFENTRLETTVADARLPHQRQGPDRAGLARRLRRGRAGGRRRARRRRLRRRAAPAQAREGRGGRRPRGQVRGQGDQAAAALLRRVPAGRDGDRRQARRRRGDARGDEGVRHRHAGHARGDHRAAHLRRLRRARRPRPRRLREGPQRHPPARASTRSRSPR